MNLLYEDLTEDIIGAYYAVYNALRRYPHYSEANYSQALAIELGLRGHVVDEQVPVRRLYRGRPVGLDYLDLVVDGKVAVEVKKVNQILDDHRKQTQTYLRDSGLVVALLMNFGGEHPEFERIFEPGNVKPGEA